jgi:enoyl-CoA hydratase
MAVDFDQQGPYAIVKINRPDARNAVNGAVAQGIEAAFSAVARRDL